MEYEGDRIWVTGAIEAVDRRAPGGPIVAGLLAFGWVPVLLLAPYLIGRADRMTDSFLFANLVAVLLIAGLPTLIRYYDGTVTPTFARKMTDRVRDPDALKEVAERHERLFARRYWLVVVPWTGLLLAVLAVSTPTLFDQGIEGIADPAYWAYAAFLLWGGLITGIGFHGIVTTVSYVRAIPRATRIVIDPYHHDGLGGMSSFGYFAIRTTVLVSTGALLLPLAFELAAGSAFEAVIYAAVVVYMAFIALSFFYPTLVINRRANEVRAERLEELREAIRDLRRDTAVVGDREADPDVDDVARQLEIQRLRDRHEDYRDVKLYPMSPEILSQLVGSVILPLITMGSRLPFVF